MWIPPDRVRPVVDRRAYPGWPSRVKAAARLEERVHLSLVGRRFPTFDADALVRDSGLGSRMTLATDVSDEVFRETCVTHEGRVLKEAVPA